MNEITLHRGSKPHLTTLKVSVNEQFLTDAVSDGLIISSATGSTAYNLSSGGPIVHPSVKSIILTPICPRSLSFRTLLLPSDCNIKLKVSQSSRIGCEVSVDGKNVGEINDGEEIVVTESDFPLPMVERETEGWIGDLNKILKWNIGFDNSNNGMKMDGMNVKVTSNDIAEANTIGTQLFWATSFLIMCLIERYSNYIQLKKESEAEKLIPTYIPIQEFLQKNKNEIEDFQKPHSFQINQNLTSSSYNDTVVENVNNVDATLEVNKNREVLIKTFLWTFNLALKYFIMLGIMSFNPLYFVFIIFGQSFGFYLTELRINGEREKVKNSSTSHSGGPC
ncbi:NADH kinase pos5 [Lobulomyces angularis]|nr:NADH kinase pos5 [Lobulomyces angularis]